jgi:hypothetical protein
VLKDADAVKDLGKMSSVLEDYSPIQIGTAGVLGQRPFTVVGRIQLRYSAGMWNEWYLLFDDGKTSWLGDSSGLYTITAEYRALRRCRRSKRCIRARPTINGAPYTAAEIRVADCIGGQGELPFKVGDGYQARVADFRRGSEFITLDYSGWPRPVIYTGWPSRWTACNASCCATTTCDPARSGTLSRQARCARLPCLRHADQIPARRDGHAGMPVLPQPDRCGQPESAVLAAGERWPACR